MEKKEQLANAISEAKESARCNFLYREEKGGILEYGKCNVLEIKRTITNTLAFIIGAIFLGVLLGFVAGNQIWAQLSIVTLAAFTSIAALNVVVEYTFYKKVEMAQFLTGQGPLPSWCNHQKGNNLKNRYNLLDNICSEMNKIYNIIDKTDYIINKNSTDEMDENISYLNKSKEKLQELAFAIENTKTSVIW